MMLSNVIHMYIPLYFVRSWLDLMMISALIFYFCLICSQVFVFVCKSHQMTKWGFRRDIFIWNENVIIWVKNDDVNLKKWRFESRTRIIIDIWLKLMFHYVHFFEKVRDLKLFSWQQKPSIHFFVSGSSNFIWCSIFREGACILFSFSCHSHSAFVMFIL